ncbi:hypothetical protein D3C76_1397930 [compost metagenome]
MEKLECYIGLAFSQLQRFARLLPRAIEGPNAEHVCPVPAEGVPVAGGEAQVIGHTLAEDDFIGVVVAESQRVIAAGAFVTNLFKLIKIGLHE